jgi:hypothetical protein
VPLDDRGDGDRGGDREGGGRGGDEKTKEKGSTSGRGVLVRAPSSDRAACNVAHLFARIFRGASAVYPTIPHAAVWLFLVLFRMFPHDLRPFWFGVDALPDYVQAPRPRVASDSVERPHTLLGPVSLALYESATQQVYVLGDVHVQRTLCASGTDPSRALWVDEWLADVVNATAAAAKATKAAAAAVVDVYLETAYRGRYRSAHDTRRRRAEDVTRAHSDCHDTSAGFCESSYMRDVAAQFAGCWQGERKSDGAIGCAWRGRARLHAVDLRDTEESLEDLLHDALRIDDADETESGDAMRRMARILFGPPLPDVPSSSSSSSSSAKRIVSAQPTWAPTASERLAAAQLLQVPRSTQRRKLDRQFANVRTPIHTTSSSGGGDGGGGGGGHGDGVRSRGSHLFRRPPLPLPPRPRPPLQHPHAKRQSAPFSPTCCGAISLCSV